jgi:hypothetical protein
MARMLSSQSTPFNRSVEAVAGVPAVPAQFFIFDSCPSNSSFRTATIHFLAAIRSILLQISRSKHSKIPLIIKLTRVIASFIRMRRPFDILRATLLSKQHLPKRAMRLFFYSERDTIIPYRDVEDHISMAQTWVGDKRVRVEKFDQSQHLGHAKKTQRDTGEQFAELGRTR